MASRSSSVTSRGEGEGADPLTPIEHKILNMLLEKQTRAQAAVAKVQFTFSFVKVENAAKTSPDSSIKREKKREKAPSPTALQEKKEEKPSTSLTKPEKKKQEKPLEDGESEFDDDTFSEGPVDDEQLDKLMDEFLAGGSADSGDEVSIESDVEMAPRETSSSGRGRTGRGSKTKRGGSRGAPARSGNEETFSDLECEDFKMDDENDSLSMGLTYMKKMSDDQVMQYMASYREEKKLPADAKFDTDEFVAWLPSKLQSLNLVPASPAAARGKKVVFQLPTTSRGGTGRGRGRGGRGSRGGQKGGSRRMDD